MRTKADGSKRHEIQVMVKIGDKRYTKTLSLVDTGQSSQELEELKINLKQKLIEETTGDKLKAKQCLTGIKAKISEYHKLQKQKYGYVKYKIELDSTFSGVKYYNVLAFGKSGLCHRCKENYLTADKVLQFIENNPVE